MIFDDPLSVRNNNPGNIRDADGNFISYPTPQDGLDALHQELSTKVSGNSAAMANKFGTDYTPTIRTIASIWAPSNENDTDAYISHLAKTSGIDPDTQLAQADIDKIIPGMISMEGGQKAQDYFSGNQTATDAPAPTASAYDAADQLLAAKLAAPTQNKGPSTADQLASTGKALLRQAEQGGSFGFMDEGQDLIGAGLAKLDPNNDASFGDLYNDARGMSKKELADDQQNHPIASIAGNVGGALLTGSALADGVKALGAQYAPAALEAITNAADANPIKTAIATAAGGGGLYGAGTGDENSLGRGGNAILGAGSGLVLGPAGYGLVKGVSGVGSAIGNKLGPIADDIGNAVSPLVNRAKNAFGGMLDNEAPQVTDDLIAPTMTTADQAAIPQATDDLIAPSQDQPQIQDQTAAPVQDQTQDMTQTIDPNSSPNPQIDPTNTQSIPPVSNDDLSPIKLAGILDENDLANLQQGRVLPMTAGDRTQNVNLQRMEQIAAENGSQPILAARAQQQAAARKPFEGMLGPDVSSDPVALRSVEQDAAEKAANALRGSFDTLKGQERAAWNTAKENGEGVGINGQNVTDDLVGGINNFLADNQYRTGDIPALDSHLAELKNLVSYKVGEDGQPELTTKLKDLENWKTRLNGIISNTGMDKNNDKRILGNISRQYDNFTTNLADSAIVNGDDTAINAFKNARGLSKQRFGFQDSDKAVTRILDNRDLSGEQLVNTILGADQLAGKGSNGRLVETMLTHAGDQAAAMQDAIKQGIMAKAFRRSITQTTDPADMSKNLISFDKMRNEIGNIISKKELFGTVFNDNEQQYMQQMYDDLKLVASKQKGAVNSSSTGAYTADMISGLGKVINNPIFQTLGLKPVTGSIETGLQRIAANSVTKKAESGLDEFIVNQINNMDARPAFYGSISASAIPDRALMSNKEKK